MALRNQKVRISGGNNLVSELSATVTMPTLSDFTLCFELERSSDKQVRPPGGIWKSCFSCWTSAVFKWLFSQKEWIFTYCDTTGKVALSIGAEQSGMQMVVNSVSCSLSSILLPSAISSSSMKMLCFLWTSTNGQVFVYSDGNYNTMVCATSAGHTVPSGGRFRLGGQCLQTPLPVTRPRLIR